MIASRLAPFRDRASVGAAGLVRPLDSVPGLASHCRELSVRAGVDKLDPTTYSLFGSALRAAWTDEAWRDINVGRGTDAAPQALIDEADFTVCQVVVHDGQLFHGPRFFEDLAQRILVVNRINATVPLVTLLRMYKYAARGYAVPARELHRVLEAVRRSPREDLEPAAVLRHGGGVVVP